MIEFIKEYSEIIVVLAVLTMLMVSIVVLAYFDYEKEIEMAEIRAKHSCEVKK